MVLEHTALHQTMMIPTVVYVPMKGQHKIADLLHLVVNKELKVPEFDSQFIALNNNDLAKDPLEP